jgi:hypothetical protein
MRKGRSCPVYPITPGAKRSFYYYFPLRQGIDGAHHQLYLYALRHYIF